MKIDKQYKVYGQFETIKNYFVDLNYFGKFHPLIKKVDQKGFSSNECSEYKVKEKPFNWLPINIYYSAKVFHFDNIVEYEVVGIPFTKMNIKYVFNKISDNEVHIEFNLVLSGLLIGKSILANKMLSAQDELMNEINKLSI